MSQYLEQAALLDRQRAADLKATDAQLSDSARRYTAALQREWRAAGACWQCHQIVTREGHADGCPWGDDGDMGEGGSLLAPAAFWIGGALSLLAWTGLHQVVLS